MKNFRKTVFLLLLLCLFSGVSLYAQGRRHSKSKQKTASNQNSFLISKKNIYVTCMLKNPHAVAGENKRFRPGATSSYATQWLVTEIDFTFGNAFSSKKGRVYMPNVKVELYMKLPLIEDHFFYGVQRLEGILVDPAQKPKTFSASLFMPPNSVYMYITTKKADKASLNGIQGVVVISDKANKILGVRAFIIGKTNSAAAIEKDLLNAVGKMRKAVTPAIALWPREKTPWQWIEPERFELPAIDLNTPKTAAAAPVSKPAPAPAKKDDEEEEE